MMEKEIDVCIRVTVRLEATESLRGNQGRWPVSCHITKLRCPSPLFWMFYIAVSKSLTEVNF